MEVMNMEPLLAALQKASEDAAHPTAAEVKLFFEVGRR